MNILKNVVLLTTALTSAQVFSLEGSTTPVGAQGSVVFDEAFTTVPLPNNVAVVVAEPIVRINDLAASSLLSSYGAVDIHTPDISFMQEASLTGKDCYSKFLSPDSAGYKIGLDPIAPKTGGFCYDTGFSMAYGFCPSILSGLGGVAPFRSHHLDIVLLTPEQIASQKAQTMSDADLTTGIYAALEGKYDNGTLKDFIIAQGGNLTGPKAGWTELAFQVITRGVSLAQAYVTVTI
jgi:hypothetical protein